MPYEASNFGAEQTGFEYPPVPSAYSGPYFTSDAYIGHQTRAPGYHASLYPYSYRSHDYRVRASYAAFPSHLSYPDHGVGVPAFRPIVPAPAPVSPSGHHIPTLPALTDHSPSPANANDTKFISYSAENHNKKRTRGTTGKIVCDRCGKKFTVLGSLTRHSKICRGKNAAKKSKSTQHKSIKSEDAGVASDHINHASGATETSLNPTEDQSPVMALNSRTPTIPVASTVDDLPITENASLMSEPTTLESNVQKLKPIQPYIPRGPDTFPDRKVYFCDVCPGTFARRDLLQIHKAEIHRLTEAPYLPDSGAIDRPWYLVDVSHENATQHSRLALRTFESGGLSTSPCEPCATRDLDCIVNPNVSSKCSYCSHRDSGVVCGAAGVMYRSVISDLFRVYTSC